jgi:hypothetical protein
MFKKEVHIFTSVLNEGFEAVFVLSEEVKLYHASSKV